MASTEPGPSSLQRTELNLNRCLCHQKEVTGKLIQFTDTSWKTLQKSAEERRDKIYYELLELFSGNKPIGRYHRECYQAYTNISLISRSAIKPESCVRSPQEEEPPAKRSLY